MPRLRIVSAVAVVLALAVSGVAAAAGSNVVGIKGGSSQLTLSSTAAQLLSAEHITLTPLAPATSSGSTFTFPVSGGHVNSQTLAATVHHRGALVLSHGTSTVTLRGLTIIAQRDHGALYALVRTRSVQHCKPITPQRRHVRCRTVIRERSAMVAELTGITHTGTTAQGTASLTPASARLINRLAGSKIVAAGETFGTGSTTFTF